MRLKKGFTLAEILIVLMVIGAIATMTIPSLMKGVTESQWKTAYKKAYNAIVNMASMERVAGNLAAAKSGQGATNLFKTMNSSLAVKAYANDADASDGKLLTAAKIFNCMLLENQSQGMATCTAQGAPSLAGDLSVNSPWIITEDNMAYQVLKPGSGDCYNKMTINDKADQVGNAMSASCNIIMVDVNGLTNGPNKINTQSTAGALNGVQPLDGDRFYIYLGTDGATSGSKKLTLEGHITDDIK